MSAESRAALRGSFQTRRVIIDLTTTPVRPRIVVTVLLGSDDTGHVFHVPQGDIPLVQSTVAPFLASARSAANRLNARTREDGDRGPATGPVASQRIIVDENSSLRRPRITVTVLLRSNAGNSVVRPPGPDTAPLRSIIAPYLASARHAVRQSNGGTADAVATTKRDRIRPPAIRAWAQANGHKLASRGRIPNAIVAAYESDLATNES